MRAQDAIYAHILRKVMISFRFGRQQQQKQIISEDEPNAHDVQAYKLQAIADKFCANLNEEMK